MRVLVMNSLPVLSRYVCYIVFCVFGSRLNCIFLYVVSYSISYFEANANNNYI